MYIVYESVEYPVRADESAADSGCRTAGLLCDLSNDTWFYWEIGGAICKEHFPQRQKQISFEVSSTAYNCF